MSLKLIARIEQFGDAGYMAYINSIKGMVESADTPEEAMKELLISLRVKIGFEVAPVQFIFLQYAFAPLMITLLFPEVKPEALSKKTLSKGEGTQLPPLPPLDKAQ